MQHLFSLPQRKHGLKKKKEYVVSAVVSGCFLILVSLVFLRFNVNNKILHPEIAEW